MLRHHTVLVMKRCRNFTPIILRFHGSQLKFTESNASGVKCDSSSSNTLFRNRSFQWVLWYDFRSTWLTWEQDQATQVRPSFTIGFWTVLIMLIRFYSLIDSIQGEERNRSRKMIHSSHTSFCCRMNERKIKYDDLALGCSVVWEIGKENDDDRVGLRLKALEFNQQFISNRSMQKMLELYNQRCIVWSLNKWQRASEICYCPCPGCWYENFSKNECKPNRW